MRVRVRHVATVLVVGLTVFYLLITVLWIVLMLGTSWEPEIADTTDIVVMAVILGCAGWLLWPPWQNRSREKRTAYRALERWLDDHREGENLLVHRHDGVPAMVLVVSNRWWRRGVYRVDPNTVHASSDGESGPVPAQLVELGPLFWEMTTSDQVMRAEYDGHRKVFVPRVGRRPLTCIARDLLLSLKVDVPTAEELRTLVEQVEHSAPVRGDD